MWVRSSCHEAITFEVKAEVELRLNKLHCLFQQQVLCPVSAPCQVTMCTIQKTPFPEFPQCKSASQRPGPKCVTRPTHKAKMFPDRIHCSLVPRLTLMATKQFGEKTKNFFLFSWFSFQPVKFLNPDCYPTVWLLWPAPKRGDKNILLGRKLRRGLYGIITTCSLSALNRIVGW